MADASSKSPTVPYVAFKTFSSVLDSFVTFLPDEIDVTMWPSYSGGTKSQLIGALKFLGLIDQAGKTSAELRKMSEHKETRPAVLAEVLRRSYPALFKLDLSKATPGSFDKVLREEYNQEGETHRKAASFFLIAAKHAGIALSPPLTTKGRLAPSKRKPNGRPRATDAMPAVPAQSESFTPSGPAKTITLDNDVTLTLTTNKDTFQMTKQDRDFVLKLLGLIEDHESGNYEELEDEDQTPEGGE